MEVGLGDGLGEAEGDGDGPGVGIGLGIVHLPAAAINATLSINSFHIRIYLLISLRRFAAVIHLHLVKNLSYGLFTWH